MYKEKKIKRLESVILGYIEQKFKSIKSLNSLIFLFLALSKYSNSLNCLTCHRIHFPSIVGAARDTSTFRRFALY